MYRSSVRTEYLVDDKTEVFNSMHGCREWINWVRLVAHPARDQLNRENAFFPVPVHA